MKLFPQTQRILAFAFLASLAVIEPARAANAPVPLMALDPAFGPGLAKVKRAAGFIEDQPNQASIDWKPNLQLLIGVKAVESSKRTIYFVQLTTLPPPQTNALGQPWQPTLRTNDWSWSPTNKNQFVTAVYPVRVRVFDETGRQLKEGQTPMAWGMLTNGLMDLCRVSLETQVKQTNAPRPEPKRSLSPFLSPARSGGEGARIAGAGKKPDAPKPVVNEELMRAMGGGFLWMFGMFQDLQTVPTVADIWAKAQCAIRSPSTWTILTVPFRGMSLLLLPRLEEVTLARVAAGNAGPHYRLPVDLKSGGRNLTRVEVVVGPAHGAEMLLAGIRSIRARHPIKTKQEFLAQVLAVGVEKRAASVAE